MSGFWGLDRSPNRVGPMQPHTAMTHGNAEDGQTFDAVFLAPEEPAYFDPDRLEQLCLKLGEACAETEVALALERIATTLQAIEDLWADGDPRVFCAAISALGRDAEMIGMTTLSHAATCVLDCCERGDNGAAMAATLARLMRVGDRSMHAVWDLEDMPD